MSNYYWNGRKYDSRTEKMPEDLAELAKKHRISTAEAKEMLSVDTSNLTSYRESIKNKGG